jgi:phenylacetate-coenzyme A ligase PaaK-like adenylate-forming protein
VKTDLRDNYPFGLFTRPVPQLARLHASSGTTGKPTVVGYTAQDLSNWADLVARSLYSAGARPATWCTTPTATACSPAAWAPTTAPRGWAVRWCPSPAAAPSARWR